MGIRRTIPIAGAVNIKLRPYLGGLALALGVLAIALPINALIDVFALARVFLVGILISAINFGLWPSIFASLISAVLYDVFFLPSSNFDSYLLKMGLKAALCRWKTWI
jgi:two-component system, OmpR family, sensor histidine kinase KdpD